MRRSDARTALTLMVAAVGISTNMSSMSQAQSYISDNNRRQSAFHFAASPSYVAYPVPTKDDTVGLIIIDRMSGKKQIIERDKAFLLYPQFSPDGTQLVFVINDAYAPRGKFRARQLITCQVQDWRCRVWLRTTATVRSPVFIDEKSLLFSSSVVDIGWRGNERHNNHDFYRLTQGADPERISDFHFHEIASIGLAGENLVFTALEAPSDTPKLQKEPGIASRGSEIYRLKFDQGRREIVTPTLPLRPLLAGKGYSSNPNVGLDGSIAFLDRVTKSGATHFNLAVSTPDGKLNKYFEAVGWTFSRPAFVASSVLANEVFDHHYETKLVRSTDVSLSTIAKLDFSDRSLASLERVRLNFEQ